MTNFNAGAAYNSIQKIHSTRDGKISAFKQGDVGDCWLLAALNSLSYTKAGAEIIENSLQYLDDGISVDLAGIGTYFISDSKLENRKFASGDDDVNAFELAIEQARSEIASGSLAQTTADAGDYTLPDSGSINRGYSTEAFYYITAKAPESESLNGAKSELLDKFIQNGNENYALSASIINDEYDSYTEVQDINGQLIALSNQHAYSVKSADENTVVIVNPHDSEVEITLSKETFLNTFSLVQGVDLSDDNPPVELYENCDTKNKTPGMTYYYNEDDLISMENFDVDGDGFDDYSLEYEYNENFEIASQTMRYYYYDENNKINAAEYDINNDGTIDKTAAYTRDENGRIIKVDIAGVNNAELNETAEYSYDENGNIEKIIKANQNERVEYTYENNQIKSIATYNSNNELLNTKTYDYDASSAVTTVTFTSCGDSNTEVLTYKDGVLASQITYGEDGNILTISQYDGEILLSSKSDTNGDGLMDLNVAFNDDGSKCAADIIYDENNEETARTFTYQNENNEITKEVENAKCVGDGVYKAKGLFGIFNKYYDENGNVIKVSKQKDGSYTKKAA